MTMVSVTVENEALAKTLGVKKGDVVQVATKRGTPTTREWRNRFRDSEIDGCIKFKSPLTLNSEVQ